jgi:hypothetical protein
MKAKQVNEFKQGGDPYDTMGIGKYDPDYDFSNPKSGDRIELIEDIFLSHNIIKNFSRGLSEILTRPELIDFFGKLSKRVGKFNCDFPIGYIFYYDDVEGWCDTDGNSASYEYTEDFTEGYEYLFKKLR